MTPDTHKAEAFTERELDALRQWCACNGKPITDECMRFLATIDAAGPTLVKSDYRDEQIRVLAEVVAARMDLDIDMTRVNVMRHHNAQANMFKNKFALAAVVRARETTPCSTSGSGACAGGESGGPTPHAGSGATPTDGRGSPTTSPVSDTSTRNQKAPASDAVGDKARVDALVEALRLIERRENCTGAWAQNVAHHALAAYQTAMKGASHDA
jgi:hypothetical protein